MWDRPGSPPTVDVPVVLNQGLGDDVGLMIALGVHTCQSAASPQEFRTQLLTTHSNQRYRCSS